MVDTIIVDSPNIEHVRHFFEDIDLEHMFKRGYDLTTYPTLKANEQAVIDQTRPPGRGCHIRGATYVNMM